MPAEETLMARHEARMSLTRCGGYLRDRDKLIRRAAALGIPKAEIARLLGMSRQTVSGIANRPDSA